MDAIRRFLQLESAGGVILVGTALLAIAIANSPLAGWYAALLDLPLVVAAGSLSIAKPLVLWINDGLMAVFFLLIGLELKREILEGELSDPRKVALPLIAAVGGMAAPVAVYLFFNAGLPENRAGWAIPAATDIAFALGVLALLGRRAPLSLKILLMGIAVFDDLGAIIIIGLFYTADLSLLSLGLAAVPFAVALACNRAGVRALTPYVLCGIVMWTCVLKSGVHATLAGVVLGMLVPLRTGEPIDDTPLRRLEHALHPWVAYLVLPLFAFANAGFSFEGMTVASLAEPLALGIALGLFLGKQAGVLAAAWLATRLGIARLPDGCDWRQIYGVSLLCGIGFTMSLFIASLAFTDPAHAATVRLAVLVGSTVSAVCGYLWLRRHAAAPDA